MATALSAQKINVYYGASHALQDVSLDFEAGGVTALIGPSGCGKSTFLRCLNRMNDLIPGCRVEGRIMLDGEDVNQPRTNVVRLRQKVGMVFQTPNVLPASIGQEGSLRSSRKRQGRHAWLPFPAETFMQPPGQQEQAAGKGQ